MSDLSNVGVAIVNYNAGEDILGCIETLKAEGIEDIVITDNGSKDGSDRLVMERHPDVLFLRLDDKGMGTGTNNGAKHLTNDYVFCLNPDTRVHPGAIAKLREVAESDPTIGIVAPRLLNTDGSLYPSARKFPNFVDSVGHAVVGLFTPNNPWTRRYRRLDANYDVQHDVDWVSGAAMFVPRKAWEQTGGFDESYYLYFEDVDLCWRMHRAGWRVVYEPASQITHIGGTGTRDTPYRYLKVHHQSAIRYAIRSTEGVQRLLLPLYIAGLLLRLPVALVKHRLKGSK